MALKDIGFNDTRDEQQYVIKEIKVGQDELDSDYCQVTFDVYDTNTDKVKWEYVYSKNFEFYENATDIRYFYEELLNQLNTTGELPKNMDGDLFG